MRVANLLLLSILATSCGQQAIEPIEQPQVESLEQLRPKHGIRTDEDGGAIMKRFRKKKRALFEADDPALVGFTIEKMLWDERWERFQESGNESYREFLWQEAQVSDPNVDRDWFEKTTSFAETFEDYKAETDR